MRELAVVKWNMLHFYGKSVMFAVTPNAITMSLIAHSLHFHVWEGETVWSFGSKTQEPRTPLGWVTHHNNIIYMFPSLYQARREAVELCTVRERLQGAIRFILYINRNFEILGRNVPFWICNFSPCRPLYQILHYQSPISQIGAFHSCAAEYNRLPDVSKVSL